MTTHPPDALNRRQLLCSSAALAAWLAAGCDGQKKESPASASTSARPSVPLRVTLVGESGDAETITRAWEAVTDQPLGITLIPLDRASPQGIAEAIMAAAAQTDVLILPLVAVAEAVHRELLTPLNAAEFETADQASGAILAAARNGAARYAAETYAIPLGASQPYLLSTEDARAG